jgi:hypothetical protein
MFSSGNPTAMENNKFLDDVADVADVAVQNCHFP